MREKIFLCLDVPKAVVRLTETVKFCIDRVGLTLFLKLCNGSQRHLHMCVDQFLTSLDFGEMKGCLWHNVESSYVGY